MAFSVPQETAFGKQSKKKETKKERRKVAIEVVKHEGSRAPTGDHFLIIDRRQLPTTNSMKMDSMNQSLVRHHS